MEIDIATLQRNFKLQSVCEKSDSNFDLRLNSKTIGTTNETVNELVTSKFACTPGCGHTGTGNSFCCSC